MSLLLAGAGQLFPGLYPGSILDMNYDAGRGYPFTIDTLPQTVARAGLAAGSVLIEATGAADEYGPTLWGWNDGTTGNAISIYNGGFENDKLFVYVESGGVSQLTGDELEFGVGECGPGDPIKVFLAWAAGDWAACVNGGTVATSTGSVPSGLTTMGVGTDVYESPWGADIGRVTVFPSRLSNAIGQALTT